MRRMTVTARTVHRAALIGTGVDAVGTGAFVSAAAIFFATQGGVSPVSVGIGLTLSAVTGALASVPVAHLADRLGPLRVFTISYGMRAAGMLGWILVSGDTAFLVYSAVFGAVDRSAASLTRSIIAAPLQNDEAVRLFGRMALPANVGYAFGAGFSGLTMFLGWPLALILVVNSASFVAVIVVYRSALRSRDVSDARVRPSALASWSSIKMAFGSPRRLNITWENFVFSFHRTLLNVYLPLLVVTHWEDFAWVVPVAFIVNAAVVALIQEKVNTWVTVGARHAIAWATSGIILGTSVLLLSTTLPMTANAMGMIALVALILFQILAEILHSAALAVYMVKLSRRDALTTDMSAMNLGGQLQNVVGPSIFGAIVGPSAWGLGVAVGCGIVIAGLRASRVSRRGWFDDD